MKRILEVQKQIGSLSKNAKNPFFKSAYLDLSDLLLHVTPIINDNGLVLLQPIKENSVGTQILDSETGVILAESFITLPELKDPQKLGSCITYFRRYTLKSLLAIAEVDDDGNKASKPAPVKPPVKPLVKQTLSNGGYEYLMSEGNFSQVSEGLNNRVCTELQRDSLEVLQFELNKSENGK